jgi:hypothetical protein
VGTTAGIERSWYTKKMLEIELEARLEEMETLGGRFPVGWKRENRLEIPLEYRNSRARLPEYLDYTPVYEEFREAQHEVIDTRFTLSKVSGQVTTEVQEETQKINEELALLDQILATKPTYDAFVAEFQEMVRQIMGELATPAGRVEEDTGIQEIVMGHGIQLSSAEMEARISNQLVSLPMSRFEKFSMVKIAENIPENPGKKCVSCGLSNNPGVLFCVQCQTKIIGANEYVIKTSKPPDVNTQLLEQRMKRIQARNMQDGILRNRANVEAEITQRQLGCSGGSTPAQKQPQQPTPQQPRHTRNVPVQNNCPTCGKSNSTESQFCNQCGTKLR